MFRMERTLLYRWGVLKSFTCTLGEVSEWLVLCHEKGVFVLQWLNYTRTLFKKYETI